MAVGSLLPENVLNYQSKANELQNQIESSKIGLSNDEQYAINQYISSESYKINEILRNNLKFDNTQENIIKHLDEALKKCNDYNGTIVRVLDIRSSKKLKEFIESLKTVTKIEILPYHDLGKFKWEELNVPYEFENVKVPTNDEIKKAKEILGI